MIDLDYRAGLRMLTELGWKNALTHALIYNAMQRWSMGAATEAAHIATDPNCFYTVPRGTWDRVLAAATLPPAPTPEELAATLPLAPVISFGAATCPWDNWRPARDLN